MNFPRFWAKGYAPSDDGDLPFESWGWSDTSVEEARQRGEESARRVAKRFAATGQIDHQRYYGDRPFREEVLETIKRPDGSPAALITRNNYGCHVLNTDGLMFIDVDLEEAGEVSGGGWWSQLLGQRGSPVPPKNEQAIVERARQWADEHAGWGWRVYRTKAGLRFAATHGFFDPEAMAQSAIFDLLTADALYRKLCQNQKCFRARLTPKPWRCGIRQLSQIWPWKDARTEKRFLDWEKRYRKSASEFSTCELIANLGNGQPHAEIAPILRVHDQRTGVGSGLPLA